MSNNIKSPVIFIFEIGYIIAIPAVVFALGGRYMDDIFGTEPWITLLGVIVSMPIAGYGVYRKIKPLLN